MCGKIRANSSIHIFSFSLCIFGKFARKNAIPKRFNKLDLFSESLAE
jgi:hypothetical protein